VFPSFPRIMLDEVQDLSRINHVMLDRLMSSGTQLIGVGDNNQSIYAFRGAMTTSMKELQLRYNMHEMTLSVSFRCPIAIVQRAWWRAPEMRWPDWAIPGKVEELGSWNAKDIPDHSAIICRNNAPLLSCALALLKAGRGVKLIGTDLGPQLIKTMKKFSEDMSLSQEKVFEAIDAWEAQRMRKGRNEAVIADKAECLRVFAGFGPTLGAAIAYAEHIFSSSGPIQLMSGHKSKGLEFDIVYHLDPQRIPSPWCKEGEALEQELNVRFVIETRSRKELYLVSMEGLEDELQ
jgi:superfamily I DNA/RNA helicase